MGSLPNAIIVSGASGPYGQRANGTYSFAGRQCWKRDVWTKDGDSDVSIKYERENGGGWYIDVKSDAALYRCASKAATPPLDAEWARYQIQAGNLPRLRWASAAPPPPPPVRTRARAAASSAATGSARDSAPDPAAPPAKKRKALGASSSATVPNAQIIVSGASGPYGQRANGTYSFAGRQCWERDVWTKDGDSDVSIKYERENGGGWYIDVKSDAALFRCASKAATPPLDAEWVRYQIQAGNLPRLHWASAAPPRTPPQPPRFSVEEHVRSLKNSQLVAALDTLGVPANTRTDAQLRERLVELVGHHDGGWEEALEAAQRRALHEFLSHHLKSRSAAQRRIDSYLTTAAQRGSHGFAAMWDQLIKEFCPPAPSAPDRRGKKLLVIGPGFGFQANEEQVKIIERAGFDVHRLHDKKIVPDPDDDPNWPNHMPLLLKEIEKFKPEAILCASRGGKYMAQLWKLMDADKVPKYPSLMINAHPDVKELPQKVKIIIVQGSKEERWPKPRGYDERGRVQTGSLEALIRTGSPKLCYLYHTIEKPGLRKREGDAHDCASLLKYQCLPRLVDALLSDCPPFTFPSSCGVFISVERRQHENFLGFEPRALRRFWASREQKGMDDQQRFVVLKGSDEFKAVEGIFNAEPSVDRFYVPNRSTANLDVEYIERVENGNLHEAMDTGYSIVKNNLTRVGCPYENGVHARWLFHGAGSAKVVDEIVENPQVGFRAELNERGLWGKGVYFARDAIYSVECPGCCDECEDQDGNKMLLLCLVQTGLPTIGEQHMTLGMPKVHEELRPKISYDTFVDCPSNPEMFVMPVGLARAYAAYIIHFS